MLYAPNEDVYFNAMESLKEIHQPTSEYWLKNWHSYRQQFALYHTQFNMNLGDYTNNRVESFQRWRKSFLKNVRYLAAVVRRLCKYDVQDEPNDGWRRVNELKSFIDTRFIPSGNDAVDCLNLSSTVVNLEGHKLIVSQLKHLETAEFQLEEESDSLHFNYSLTVEKSQKKYLILHDVNQSEQPMSCTCKFFCNFCLPCWHLFAIRRFCGYPLIVEDMIVARWRKETALVIEVDGIPISQTSSSITRLPLTIQERFSNAKCLTTDILAHLTSCGSNEMQEKANVLEGLLKIWKSGGSAFVRQVLQVFPFKKQLIFVFFAG